MDQNIKNMVTYITPENIPTTYPTVTRKSMLNKSNIEYVEIACNAIQGCHHGCPYCYAKNIALRSGRVRKEEDWGDVKIVANALELIAKEIWNLKPGTIPLICTMSDVFMYGRPDITSFTLQAIAMINNSGFNCATLTKGILPANELSYLSRYNVHGITLSSLDEENYRKKYEPGASPIYERVMALRRVHDLGMKTWVSMEPYPTPNMIEQNIIDVLEAVNFVDYLVFGRFNRFAEASSYPYHKEFYNEQAQIVKAYCDVHGIVCHIKNGTIS